MNAVEIIMRRDGVLFEDAKRTVDDAIEAIAAMIAKEGGSADAEEVWTRETGLEPDYLEQYMDAVYLAVASHEEKAKKENSHAVWCYRQSPAVTRTSTKTENFTRRSRRFCAEHTSTGRRIRRRGLPLRSFTRTSQGSA